MRSDGRAPLSSSLQTDGARGRRCDAASEAIVVGSLSGISPRVHWRKTDRTFLGAPGWHPPGEHSRQLPHLQFDHGREKQLGEPSTV